MKPTSPEQHAERLRLYNLGLSDVDIGKRVGCSKDRIFYWRKLHGLPAHFDPRKERQRFGRRRDKERLPFYRLGWTDAAIARAVGADRNTVRRWRESRGLPAHRKPMPPTLAENAEQQRLRLYRLGHSDGQIARALGIGLAAINRRRTRRGLDANYMPEHGGPIARAAGGTISLDADLGEGGFNLHGLIADDAAAEWLEQAGATRW